MARMTLEQAAQAAAAALRRAGANGDMARITAEALVLAEAQGIASHGLARVAQYALHLRNGRADGEPQPTLAKRHGAALLVDARDGLAFPACRMAVLLGIETAQELGLCFAGVRNSHHAGVLVDHLRPAARAGLVGLAFANSPADMPAAGGQHPVFGANPIAAIFPRRDADPLMIDLSLSEVARGKLPMGAATSAKGAMLALIVELLVVALTGSHFGYEASSFFVEEGNRPRIAQAFLLIDPKALAGDDRYRERVEALVSEMLVDDGVRLAGARRLALERKAREEGIEVPDPLLASWGG